MQRSVVLLVTARLIGRFVLCLEININNYLVADPWHFALARVANACRANGLVPVDGPFTNIADPDGHKAATLRSAAKPRPLQEGASSS